MLNEMRYGKLSAKSIQAFKALSRPITYEDGIGPTELFPRREDVDAANNARMGKLAGVSRTYDCIHVFIRDRLCTLTPQICSARWRDGRS